MSKTYPYMPGDMILNKEANLLYYIEEISKIHVFLRCDKHNKSFSMRKFEFKGQLESERGKMILVYYPVSK
jgi:hypothetical protein